MLNGRNIRAKHRCKKLEDKMLGPFDIISVGNNVRYCKLKLPDSWKIHSVFNIDLLELYKGTDHMKQVVEIEADGNDWVMELIIASGPSDDNPRCHVFLVKWKDFEHEENTWEKYDNVAESNSRLLEEYYKKNLSVEKDGRFMKGNKRKVSKK